MIKSYERIITLDDREELGAFFVSVGNIKDFNIFLTIFDKPPVCFLSKILYLNSLWIPRGTYKQIIHFYNGCY